MIQADLFTPTYPDVPGAQRRDTSQAAASAIEPKVGRLQAMVLEFIRECGGATDEEIQVGLALKQNTARPRRCELYLKGLVKDSGQRRSTSSGRLAAVWVAT
jgi:hypothetical protein